MRKSNWMVAVVSLAMVGGMALPTFAQDTPPAPAAGGNGGNNRPGRQGNNGGGNRPTPEQRQQRMLQHVKESLGSSDDEWKILQPKFEKMQQLRMQSMTGPMGGRGPGGLGGPGGQAGPDQASNPIAVAMHDLQQTLSNKDATPEQIKAKVQAVRDAKTKAREELVAAQKELLEVLAPREEAVLISMGLLD